MTRLSLALGSAALALAGCNQQSRTTMDLLRGGEAGVCTAADVEDTVRQLIRPKGVVSDAYTISFADASLEAFDKVVARATCNAALTIGGPNGPLVERTMIDFTISPAAQDPSSFIVSGAFAPFTEQIKTAVADADAARADQEGAQQAQEELAALVKPAWLIGRWVPTTSGSEDCSSGPYDDYQRGGRVSNQETTGRWQLSGQQLSIVLPRASDSFTITSASMDAFTMVSESREESSYRRCDPSGIQAERLDTIEELPPLAGMDTNDAEPATSTPE